MTPHDEVVGWYAAPRSTVEIAADGSWFRIDGEDRVELGTRKALARIVALLGRERLRAPGTPVPRAELVDAGWPDERILPKAAANRLGVALTTLRKLGLRDQLLRRRDGYLLTPSVTVRRVD